jgi:hypothetical protein
VEPTPPRLKEGPALHLRGVGLILLAALIECDALLRDGQAGRVGYFSIGKRASATERLHRDIV